MILFLDFDGVTHPETTNDLFCCAPLLWEILRACPHVDVVFSTSWREHYPFDELVGFATSNGGEDLTARFIGATPVIPIDPLADEYRRREIECQQWIDENAPGRKWLALDDMSYWFSYGENQLYLVDYVWGLKAQDVPKVIGLLT